MNLFKNKRKIHIKIISILIICIFILLSFASIFIKPSLAYTEQPYIGGQWVYIKNAYSGRYLDVNGGIAGNGVNVQQWEGNESVAQAWYLFYQGNGEYVIGSLVRFNCF